MSLRRTESGYMAVTQVILPTRFSPLHMPVACMFVNAVSKMTTPRGIKALANGMPLVSDGNELAIRTAYPRAGTHGFERLGNGL